MKLIGYIRPCKEYSFTIPVYHNGQNFYYHNLDNNFFILSFTKDEINESYIIKLPRLKYFQIGSKAPIVFIGANDKIIIGKSDEAIIEICNYLDQNHLPKKYIQEEVFYYANQLGHNIKPFENKYDLRYFIFNNHPIILEDVENILVEIESYISIFNVTHQREYTFKFQNKSQNANEPYITPIDKTLIDGFTNNFILNIIENNILRAFQELRRLFDYQFKVSTPRIIVKSLSNLSQTVLGLGYISVSKILSLISNIFEINDIDIFPQFAKELKTEWNMKLSQELCNKVQKQYPYGVDAKFLNIMPRLKKHSDQEIIQGIKSGESDALKYLAKDFFPVIRSYILKNNGNDEDAKDIFQDALYIIIERIRNNDFVLHGTLSTYLFPICKNLWLMALDRQKAAKNYELRRSNSYENIFRQCFDSMDEVSQKILKMYWMEISPTEIAEKLGYTYGYVRKKKSECMEELKNRIINRPDFSELRETLIIKQTINEYYE